MAILNPPTDVIENVIQLVSNGHTLQSACRNTHGLQRVSHFYAEIYKDEAVQKRYERARMQGVECLVDQIIEIADNTEGLDSPNAMAILTQRKMAIDSRKWYASKLCPHRYGDRVALDHGGQDDNPIQVVKRIIVDSSTAGSVIDAEIVSDETTHRPTLQGGSTPQEMEAPQKKSVTTEKNFLEFENLINANASADEPSFL